MKYYHFIYNSSERSIKGSAGLGIRTCSEDFPKEVIAAVEKEKDFFNFNYKGCSLSSDSLNRNPELISNVIPTWIYATIPSSNGKKIHVLGREIAVGFDYSFYATGRPTRLGNFVGDFYVTLDTPTADFWNLMYTRPDGIQMIPASPIPTQDNEEMRSISLGHPQMLPPMDTLHVAAPRDKGVNEWALEIVFAIIESRKLQKPLIVKMPSQVTSDILADVFRLLPIEIATDCPFITNYHGTGRRIGYNLFTINESYSSQIVAELWHSIDLTKGIVVNNAERDTFLPIIKNYAENGMWEYAQNTIRWIVSEEYANMANNDAKLNSLILDYLNKDNFEFGKLSQNKELINALAPILQNREEKREYLNNYLWEQIRKVTAPAQIKAISQELRALDSLGTDTIAQAWMSDATKIAFESSEAFVALYNSVRGELDSVANVVDFSKCANYDKYLSAFVQQPNIWRKLRPRFIPQAIEKFEEYILRAIEEGFDFENFMAAVEIGPDKAQIIDCLLSIYEKSQYTDSKIATNALKHVGEIIKTIDYYPFITKAPNKYGNKNFNQFYLWDIYKDLKRKLPNISIEECNNTLASLTTILEKDCSIKQDITNLSEHFYAIITGSIVKTFDEAYKILISTNKREQIDEVVGKSISDLINLLDISRDTAKNNKEHVLAKAINMLYITYDILQNNTAYYTPTHTRRAVEFKRPLYVKAILPLELSRKLDNASAKYIATECVNCGAITLEELLTETQKEIYLHNRNVMWPEILHNMKLKPDKLVKKIAGLLGKPDAKGNFSKDTINNAIHFMNTFMHEEYLIWEKSNNSPIKKFFRAIGKLFQKSPQKVAKEDKMQKESVKKLEKPIEKPKTTHNKKTINDKYKRH